ncbi:MAG: histone deacetylase [Actinobacteria bacterium ATB1]|nr:histone deacetylase [Actinobacteria bacterium ATB1]
MSGLEPGVAVFHDTFLQHDPGPGHPERAARLTALLDRIEGSTVLSEAIMLKEATPASDECILAAHSSSHLRLLESVDEDGGGALDPDTRMSKRSLEAARLAAGAGLDAVRAVEGGAPFAFSLARPPGHHAERDRAMGFCLLNNIAIATRFLRDRSTRVAVVDWDAHHGNGTQQILWDDPGSLFISLHEYPAYPGTGRLSETGPPHAPGTTLNFALPPGTGERTYLRAFDEAIVPALVGFAPDWILLSAGFDAHRADPITNMGLRTQSFGLLALRLGELSRELTGKGVVAFLEGGYDLHALAGSFEATALGLLGESSSADGEPPADDVYDVAADVVDAQAARVRDFWGD